MRELHPFLLSPKGCLSAALQEGLGIELPEDIDQTGDDPRPSRLVAGAEAGAVVAVEVFVEQQMIAPMGIALKFFGAPEYRPPAGFVAQEDPGQPIGNVLSDLEQIHQLARSG